MNNGLIHSFSTSSKDDCANHIFQFMTHDIRPRQSYLLTYLLTYSLYLCFPLLFPRPPLQATI